MEKVTKKWPSAGKKRWISVKLRFKSTNRITKDFIYWDYIYILFCSDANEAVHLAETKGRDSPPRSGSDDNDIEFSHIVGRSYLAGKPQHGSIVWFEYVLPD
jgi:hypothetical protein